MRSCGHPTSANEHGACAQCDQREAPEGLEEARRTPTFDATTVPPALLKDHHTTVWALLVVTEGTVEFTESETQWHETATPDNSINIVPNRMHHISPSPDARFHVRFYTASL